MPSGFWSFKLDIDNDTADNLNVQPQALPSGTGWIPGFAVDPGTWLQPDGQGGLTAGVYSNDPEWPPSMTFVVPAPAGSGSAFIGAGVDKFGRVTCYLLANDFYNAVVVQYPGTPEDPLPNHPYCSMTVFPGGTKVPNGIAPPGHQQPKLGAEAEAGPDRGLRSVEVNLISHVEADMMVHSAELGTPQSQWIGGEVAGTGVPILPGMPWTFGVTIGGAAWAEAAASLTIGLHDQPMGGPQVGLAFSNGPDGVSTCTFTPGAGVTATVSQVDTGDPAHSLFHVALTGAMGGAEQAASGAGAVQSPAA